ncbi:hypothetical protein [Pseudoclavibacter sp. 13-3]|uniref:hypothetical protein n=1 Tax=Pseudoclavibacter sp. 13-3 TaxID=2901228 RepID=UPI003FA78D19
MTTQSVPVPVPELQIEFCGEWHPVSPYRPFTIGREGDLAVDDNPFLHRRLLEIHAFEGLWLLSNIGSRLAVTVSDADGHLQSWLAPGGRLPLVFGLTTIVFSAGATTYELSVHVSVPLFAQTQPALQQSDGTTTIGAVTMTDTQRLLIIALAEPMLRRDGTGISEIPTNHDAAQRLGWVITRFNRKLDNVCDKLDRIGVPGLRGGPRSYATNRRVRLVEYAITSHLVSKADLILLDQPHE